MQTRSSRLARGWTVGLVATLVAAISHDLGGGDFPGWLALLVGAVFAGTAGTVLIGRRPSLGRLIAVVAVGQGAFHVAFSQLGAPAPLAAAPHAHDASLALADPGHAAHLLSPAMLAGHLLAGAVTIAVLAGAERAVLRMLVELALVGVTRLLALVPSPLPAPARAAEPSTPVASISRRVVAVRPRRGPPVPSFA